MLRSDPGRRAPGGTVSASVLADFLPHAAHVPTREVRTPQNLDSLRTSRRDALRWVVAGAAVVLACLGLGCGAEDARDRPSAPRKVIDAQALPLLSGEHARWADVSDVGVRSLVIDLVGPNAEAGKVSPTSQSSPGCECPDSMIDDRLRALRTAQHDRRDGGTQEEDASALQVVLVLPRGATALDVMHLMMGLERFVPYRRQGRVVIAVRVPSGEVRWLAVPGFFARSQPGNLAEPDGDRGQGARVMVDLAADPGHGVMKEVTVGGRVLVTPDEIEHALRSATQVGSGPRRFKCVVDGDLRLDVWLPAYAEVCALADAVGDLLVRRQ